MRLLFAAGKHQKLGSLSAFLQRQPPKQAQQTAVIPDDKGESGSATPALSTTGTGPDDDDASDADDGEDEDVLGPPSSAPIGGNVVFQAKRVPGPADLSQTPEEGPKRIYLRQYPGHEIGKALRRFVH